MKPIKNIYLADNKTVIHPQTIEEKLREAEKDYEEGKTYSEDDVWDMLSRKHGFEL